MTPLDRAAIAAEYALIVETLKKTKFNKSKAAELLQIDRKTLYNKIRTYDEHVAKWEEYQKILKDFNIDENGYIKPVPQISAGELL